MLDSLSQITFSQLAKYALAASIAYCATLWIYRLYFHPLSHIPGPKRAALSNVWWAKHWISGKWPGDLERLHAKYGKVVRIAVNEISFASTQAQQDIYGHPKAGKDPFLKSGFYKSFDNAKPSISRMRDPEEHRQARKALSHAFSTKALRDQQDIVLKYVHLLVKQVKAKGDTEEGIDLNDWYNWVTFDMIGDLTFGESFGCVEQGKAHFWISLIFNNLKFTSWIHVFRRIPVTSIFLPFIVYQDPHIVGKRDAHAKMSRERVIARMSKSNDRDDFYSHLLRDKSSVATEDFFVAHATTLVLAGSETSSTLLSSLTYFLLNNPDTLKILQDEVRGAFKDLESIDGNSTSNLPYLFAVIEEGLRIFPPVAFGLPRDSPGEVVDGVYVPKGTVVAAHSFSISRSSEHFHSPLAFAPERWLPDTHPLYNPRFANDNKDASKPFSLGTRACIGINLAYMELRIILAAMVFCFDWALVDGPEGTERVWERDSNLYILWMKPSLRVRCKAVPGNVDA